ncbi:MAG: acetoacetate-CoA ligase [Candidatus Dadabacteria bacterium]|nr:MAG: acetoacetate-CoA ligase [Candidatus Dadabacteria bacterium]
MNKILWNPDKEIMHSSSMMKLGKTFGFVKDDESLDYASLHNWSVNNLDTFWREVWEGNNIIGNFGEEVFSSNEDIRKASFFPDTELNFAENLLVGDENRQAISFHGEGRESFSLTLKQLRENVASLAKWMKEVGVEKGDCIATLLPNCPETIITMLAASSLGAVFTSCSPDFGIEGILDRFGQSKPKILISCDGYGYGGKIFEIKKKTIEVKKSISSINELVFVNYLSKNKEEDSLSWNNILEKNKTKKINFERVPFNSPLYILYSSGTTGKPKCIVHSVGGVLLQHIKEHTYHCDFRKDDRIMYFTTCGWMMWNWMVSALAKEVTLVIYDGSPVEPDMNILFKIADTEKLTFLGVSAKYIDSLAKANAEPKKYFNLSSLRVIASTGSPLGPLGYDWVYSNVKDNVQLSSMSGGTDLVACFVGGNPCLPVFRGEIQCAILGMDTQSWKSQNNDIINEAGELVCVKPFPSMPIEFLNDKDDEKYKKAYFTKYSNVWHHGDFVIKTNRKTFIVEGRSDATLNPGGIRIGTAEIYRHVENHEKVKEALAVGQDWEGDQRIILYLILKEGILLDNELNIEIKSLIRQKASPRHVPSKIFQVDDFPRTRSGKISELAVKDIIHGKEIKNTEALINPEILNNFRDFKDLFEK